MVYESKIGVRVLLENTKERCFFCSTKANGIFFNFKATSRSNISWKQSQIFVEFEKASINFFQKLMREYESNMLLILSSGKLAAQNSGNWTGSDQKHTKSASR